MSELGYTIEELEKETGFAKKFIYDLTSYNCVSRPSRGIDSSLPSGKGIYPIEALHQLQKYRGLRQAGMSRKEVMKILQREVASIRQTKLRDALKICYQ